MQMLKNIVAQDSAPQSGSIISYHTAMTKLVTAIFTGYLKVE
jgi:hypothetical protein